MYRLKRVVTEISGKTREFKFLFQPRSDKENENLNLISDKLNGKVSYPVLVTESN